MYPQNQSVLTFLLKVTGHSKKICRVPNKSSKSIENMQKGGKLLNLKSKLPETRAFKGTCYLTKRSCTDGGIPTLKLFFLSDQSL